MTKNKEYKLNLLDESSASEDLFEDKTHHKIASTLYEIIQHGSSDGLTIGLEGGWGSGKSTVVSILKNKLEADTNTICFYFDAWAHEGDPLRRVFLEALIDQVGNDDKELLGIKSRVSNRIKTSNVRSSQTVTKLGKWLALAALFVPLGAAIISDTASKIDFKLNGPTNWLFLIGIICVMAPVFVLARNAWKLWRNNCKIADLNNWMFLQGESESIVTQEISEDEERSSIEFEQYFTGIVDVLFSKKTNVKLLIVIDNLDRVDADDSLKIWSTLQTFLQRKNPSHKGSSSFKKIWVLVPYDEEGLAKLWKHRANGQHESFETSTDPTEKQKSHYRECAKSFFDKCFQLRIEVPKLILTGWEKFCAESIDQALIGWEEIEKNNVLNVLKWTRESVDDIPTPREIKTFVNQVGLLRLHCEKDISIESLAYFAVQKYVKFQTNRDIERLIISGKLPPSNHKPIFNENLTAELCGILFGVSSSKGQQLLLEPKIERAMNTKNVQGVTALVETHQNAFWTVLNLHLTRMSDLVKMTHYSSTVWNGLWKSTPNKCREFVSHLKAGADTLKSLELPTQNDLDDHVAMFSLLEEGDYDFSKIWKDILQSLSKQMQKADFDFTSGNRALTALAACQKKKLPVRHQLPSIPIENWMKWATACISEGVNSYALVKPAALMIKEISSKIVAGSPLPEGLHDLIAYLVKTGETQWEPVITATQSYIDWNQGTPSGDVFKVEIFEILTMVSESGQKNRKAIEPILKSGPFYNLAHNLNPQGAIKHAALVLAKCLPGELDSVQIPAVGNSSAGLELIRSFWTTSDSKSAQFVWDELKFDSDFQFIWELAKNTKNVLIGDVIKLAVNENNANFFSYSNPLHLFESALAFTDNEREFQDKLSICFIDHGHIEESILETGDLDIIAYSTELNIIAENSANPNVAGCLKDMISLVTKEQWGKALAEDSYLTTLAVTLNEKSPKLQLGDMFYESLLSYLQDWLSNKVKPSDSQIYEFTSLINLMKSSFKTQLKSRLSMHLIDIDFKSNLYAVTTLQEYMNIKKLMSDGSEKIQFIVEDFIRTSNTECLKILDLILSNKDSSEFKPSDHLAELFQEPMIHLLETIDGTDSAYIERLAKIFGVDLTKQPKKDENSESTDTEDVST